MSDDAKDREIARLRRLLSAASLEAGIAEEGETAGAAPCRCGGFRTPGDRKCGIAIGGRAKCPGGTVWEWTMELLRERAAHPVSCAAAADAAENALLHARLRARVAALEAAVGDYLAKMDYCLTADDITLDDEGDRDAAERRLRALLSPGEAPPCPDAQPGHPGVCFCDGPGCAADRPKPTEPCAACGGSGRAFRCHGEPPHREYIELIACPECRGGWKP